MFYMDDKLLNGPEKPGQKHPKKILWSSFLKRLIPFTFRAFNLIPKPLKINSTTSYCTSMQTI